MNLQSIIHDLTVELHPLPTRVEATIAPLKEIKAILFDIYGTLLISGSGDVGTAKGVQNHTALTQALHQASIPGELATAGNRGAELLLQEIKRYHGGMKVEGMKNPEVEIREVWTTVTAELMAEGILDPQVISPEQINSLAIGYECRVNPTWIMPGADTLLAALNQTGTPLGIVSNAQFYTPLILRTIFGKSPADLGFQPSLTSWSFKHGESKPSISLFAPVMEVLKDQYDIEPCQTVYIGNDMLNDVWTAHELGLKTILFAGDQRSLRMREECEVCNGLVPDRTITSLSQVLACLQAPPTPG